jgi:hypothetical protein
VDGVLGPAYAVVEEHPPSWVLRSRLYERPQHRTGTLLRWNQCYTSNVLIRKAGFKDHNIWFNTEFKTGGSDQEFFRVAVELGYRFIAVEEAPVYEVMPPRRWTKWYFVRRALVNGYNSRRYTAGRKPLGASLLLDIKSILALLCYSFATPFAFFAGTHLFMNCVVRGAYHLSRLCAGVGLELWSKRDF